MRLGHGASCAGCRRADDPSMHSSQNEQDSRFYGEFAAQNAESQTLRFETARVSAR